MSSAIDTKYNQLIATNSWIGKPTTAEQVCPDGVGHYRHYEGASIYWSPVAGAQWLGSDEPYMFLGVSTSGQAQTPYETGVMEVDKGTVIRSAKRPYSGIARDVILAVVIRENDEGDPHAFSGAFKSILDMGNAALASQRGVGVPGEVVQLLSNKLSELTGAGDDDVDRRAELLTMDSLIQMAKQAEGGDPVARFYLGYG